MRLLIITTREDKSFKRIVEEARKKGIDVSVFFYERLTKDKLRKIIMERWDFSILRDPYNSGNNFSKYMLFLSKKLNDKIMDKDAILKFPYYEDKLFQYKFFKDIVKMLKTWFFLSLKSRNIKKLEFPVVVKKRISSRSKDVFLIRSYNEFFKFFKKRKIKDYIVSEYIDVYKDLRIVFLNNRIISCVEREVRMSKKQGFLKLGVRVKKNSIILRKLREMVFKITKKLKCDFCGIDFLIDKKGKIYLVECNLSPQFIKTEKKSKKNIALELIKFIEKKVKENE